MAKNHFTTRAQLSNRQRQIDFAPTVTIAPQETNQTVHIQTPSSMVMMVVFMLAGFALGHVVRRGRDLIHQEYWRIMSSYIGRMVMATTKQQGQ